MPGHISPICMSTEAGLIMRIGHTVGGCNGKDQGSGRCTISRPVDTNLSPPWDGGSMIGDSHSS